MSNTREITATEFVAKLNSLTKEEITQIGKTRPATPIELASQVRENLTKYWLEELKTCPEKAKTGISITHNYSYSDFYFETIKDMGYKVTPNMRIHDVFVTRIELV